MPMVRAMRMLNAIEAGTLTGAQLEALLVADPGRLAEFSALVGMRGQLLRIRSSETARTALFSSQSAVGAVVSNDVALRQWLLYDTTYSWRSFANLAAVLASAPAMARVAASSSAMALVAGVPTLLAAVIAAPTALSAVVASSVAMGVLAANSTAMTAVVASSTAMTAAVASSTAMTAIAASGTAMPILAASSAAMTTVAASSTAMAALVASSSAMTAVAASTTAKMAMFADDVALAAIAGSSTALTALRGAAGYAVSSAVSSTSAQALPGATAGASYILLGVSCASIGSITITSITTRRSGSARPITASVPATGTDATKTTMCTPLVSPFNWTSNTTGQTWYFGLLRCDV